MPKTKSKLITQLRKKKSNKPKKNIKKVLMKVQAEINEVRNRNISDLINKSQSWLFWWKKIFRKKNYKKAWVATPC